MAKELRDENGHPLEEGIYLRIDGLLGMHTTQSVVYISRKDDKFYEDYLDSGLRPLQVSDQTTFRPFSKRDLIWLWRKLSRLEQTVQSGEGTDIMMDFNGDSGSGLPPVPKLVKTD